MVSVADLVRSNPTLDPWVNAEAESKHVAMAIVLVMIIMMEDVCFLFLCACCFSLRAFSDCENSMP